MKNTKTILIVEDEVTLSKILKEKISKEEFSVITAADGEEGVEMAKKYKPDFIILDLLLPKITGEEALKRIRKTNKEVPVIILSAKADDATIANCINNLGALDYMIKSNHSLDEIVNRIKQYL
jgi:two-component system alkaline phosphatase synthesis response regulator PhoP